MFQRTLPLELVATYIAAAISIGLEEYLLSFGSQWSNLPPIAFAIFISVLAFRSKRTGLLLLLALPAILVAEKQVFFIFFMVVPYLFSNNPSI